MQKKANIKLFLDVIDSAVSFVCPGCQANKNVKFSELDVETEVSGCSCCGETCSVSVSFYCRTCQRFVKLLEK